MSSIRHLSGMRQQQVELSSLHNTSYKLKAILQIYRNFCIPTPYQNPNFTLSERIINDRATKATNLAYYIGHLESIIIRLFLSNLVDIYIYKSALKEVEIIIWDKSISNIYNSWAYLGPATCEDGNLTQLVHL